REDQLRRGDLLRPDDLSPAILDLNRVDALAGLDTRARVDLITPEDGSDLHVVDGVVDEFIVDLAGLFDSSSEHLRQAVGRRYVLHRLLAVLGLVVGNEAIEAWKLS